MLGVYHERIQGEIANQILVLRSLKAITKETPMTTRCLGWASPDPGFCPQVELSGRDTRGLLDLLGSGKTLTSERITAEEAPPTLLEIEPASPGGNEDVVDARMLLQPGAGLETVVAAQIISDHKDISAGVVSFDVGERGNGALGIA